jgi:large subunit ribosomal protein L17
MAKYRKLSRTASQRKALLRNQVTQLIYNGKIKTTEAKAKEISGLAEQLITLAKRGDLAARRQAIAQLADEDVVRKLFGEIAEQCKDRQGGYTRILKLGPRRGDAAPMVILELVK